MRSLDEEIARHLRDAADAGELCSADSYGKPQPEIAGWQETPAALRMPFKILKDAGVVPPEVEMLRERAALQASIDACDNQQQRAELQRRLNDLNLSISLRLERLRAEAG